MERFRATREREEELQLVLKVRTVTREGKDAQAERVRTAKSEELDRKVFRDQINRIRFKNLL